MTLKNLLSVEGYMVRAFAMRLAILKQSFDIGMQHIFWGVGGYNLNNFVEHGTHNQFLNMFAENGIITFVMYSSFVLFVTIEVLLISGKLKKTPDAGVERKISACLAAVMCGSLVQAMVSYLRYDFWVLCGISITWIAIVNKQTVVNNRVSTQKLLIPKE